MGTLILRGVGEVTATPDIAELGIAVRSFDKVAAQALSASATAMTDVMSLLEERGVAKENIQTTGFCIGRQYNPKDKLEWHAANQIVVTLTDITVLGSLLAAVGKAAEIDYLGFCNSQIEQLTDEARKLALQNAIHRAGVYCEAGGFTLKKILEVTEQGTPRTTVRSARMESMGGDFGNEIPIQESEQTAQVHVQVTFEFETEAKPCCHCDNCVYKNEEKTKEKDDSLLSQLEEE